MDNMARERFVISFLEQENSQLKARQLIMEKEQTKLLQQGGRGKGKAVLEPSEHEETEKQVRKKRPWTKGLKKALKEEKEHNLPHEDLDMEDRIPLEVNEDREYWLNKVNDYLEKLLDKANEDNQLLRHMAHYYQTRNMISNIKLK